MPAYNSEQYVQKAVESVINQTYSNWELIVVDDGSTDSTGTILDKLATSDSRIKVIHQSNKGSPVAKNVGLDLAQGEWITFLDSDDFYNLDALKLLIENSDQQDLVIGEYEFLETHFTRKHFEKTIQSFDDLKSSFVEFHSNGVYASVCDKLFRKSILQHRFNTNDLFVEDAPFVIETLKSVPRIKVISKTIFYYRRETPCSRSKRWQIFNPEVYELISKTAEELFDYDSKITTYCEKNYILYFIKYVRNLCNAEDIDINTKISMLTRAINNDYFNKLTAKSYYLDPQRMREFIILKTKDLQLIQEFFHI